MIGVLHRFYHSKDSTLGVFELFDKGLVKFQCCTLELPDCNNEHNISCIPVGEYDCEFTLSPHLKKETYEVMNVPDRSGIRIHSGNYTTQIKGCLLFGKQHVYLNCDGILDVNESKKTIKKFEEILNNQPFKLTIK